MHQVQQHWAKAMFSGGGGGDKSWYGVRGGPNPGVCSSWDAARKLSHGVSGARVKKFATEAEARAFARVLTPTQASEALLLAAAAAAHVSEGGLAGSEGALAGLQPNLASQAPATSSPAAAVAQEQQRQEQQQPQPPKPAWPAAYPVVVTKIASEAELAAAVSVAVAEPCNSGEALPPSRGGAGADSDGGRGRAKAPRWSADEEQKLAQLLAAKEARGGSAHAHRAHRPTLRQPPAPLQPPPPPTPPSTLPARQATGQTWGAIARELGARRDSRPRGAPCPARPPTPPVSSFQVPTAPLRRYSSTGQS